MTNETLEHLRPLAWIVLLACNFTAWYLVIKFIGAFL